MDDPGLARKVLRKLDRAQGNAELLEIGKSDPLEEVARAAYRRVDSQKELAALGAKVFADGAYPDRKDIGAAILRTGDEALVRQTVQKLLAGPHYPGNKQFVLDAAAAYPGIVKELWPKVRRWGRVSTTEHTDYMRKAPHVDSTRYYDFYRYPDGRVVPNRGGRQKHTDGSMPSSNCANYGHTDMSSHTDNTKLLEKGYLALFPKAVRGDD